MNRPYIFCHMLMSLDGKIMGSYMDTPALFETRGGLANDKPVSFALENVQAMDGDSVWLRYKVKY